MLVLVLEIALGFFAVLGVIYTVLGLFDAYTLQRAGLRCRLTVKEISSREPEHQEYALRILEGLLSHNSLGGAVEEIVLAESAGVDETVAEKMKKEYGNIYREVTVWKGKTADKPMETRDPLPQRPPEGTAETSGTETKKTPPE